MGDTDSASQIDGWARAAARLYGLDEVQLRVRAKAARLAAECTRMRNSGRNVPVLEVEDFICHAWILALKTRPDFPDRMGMVLFFWRRMENLFKDKCKRSAASKTYSIPIDAEAAEEPATQAEISVLSFEKHRETHRERENADALRSFQDYLCLNVPELLPLYNLMIREQIDSPREQAQRLHLEVKDIYRLRARLSQFARQMGQEMNSGAPSRAARLPRPATERVSYSPVFRLYSGRPPEGTRANGRMDQTIFAHPDLSISKAFRFFRGIKPRDDNDDT